MKKTMMLMLMMVGSVVMVQGAEYYVSTTGSDSSGDGSLSLPFRTIQKAVDVAPTGSEIIVGDGTYAPITTANKAITIRAQNTRMVTIDAQGVNRCATLGTAPSQTSTVLTGFKLVNGNANHPNVAVSNGNGGGAFGGRLNDCLLQDNTADSGGGAFTGSLNNCVLEYNTAEQGGGAWNSVLNNCVLSWNTANSGGGALYGTLNDCTLMNNTAADFGGGVFDGSLNNCILLWNTAEQGGGVCNGTLKDCRLMDNTALAGGGTFGALLNRCELRWNTALLGGGAYGDTLNNCLLVGNEADSGGGAFWGSLNNCTLAWNSASIQGGGTLYGTLNNCILWMNSASGMPNDHFESELYYCRAGTLPTGTYNKGGNITADPLFVNGNQNGNYHLQPNSPCVNKGVNAYAPSGNDLDGNPRIAGGLVDMGAYELQLPTVTAVTASQGTYLDRVALTWTSAGAVSYKVFRGTSDVSGLSTLIASPTSASYSDTAAVAGTTYYYWVRAVNAAGETAMSAAVSGFRAITLVAPTGVTASIGTYSDKIEVSWDAVPGATGYRIYRSLITPPNYTFATQVGTSTATTFDDTDSTLVSGMVYYYWVRATSAAEPSGGPYGGLGQGVKATLVLPPAAPSWVWASQGMYASLVSVSWEASPGAASYKLFRHTEDNSAGAVEIAATENKWHDDWAVGVGTNYYYWVRAVNSGGTGPFSAPGNNLTSASAVGWRWGGWTEAPAAPTRVWASHSAFTGYIQVRWDTPAFASTYRLFRATVDDPAQAQDLGTVSQPHNDTTAAVGTVYYYWVKASNSVGTSGFSDPAAQGLRSASVVSPPLVPVVTASQGVYADRVRLTWTASAGAEGYLVYYNTENYRGTATQLNGGGLMQSHYSLTCDHFPAAAAGTVYYYWVQAGQVGIHPLSDNSVVTTGWTATIPAPPTSVMASRDNSDRIRVGWAASTGAASYKVYRNTTGIILKLMKPVGTISAPPLLFDDTTATPMTTYYYWVVAVNAAGESNFSSPAAEGVRLPFVTVFFNGNGGKPDESSVVQKFDGGTTYTLPSRNPEWDGYLFAGWFTQAEGGTLVTSGTRLRRIDDHTLWAHWRDPLLDYEAWRILKGNLANTPEHWRIWLTNPNDFNTVLRAHIEMPDTGPSVWWEPDLGILRKYTILVNTNLADNVWEEITPQELPSLEAAPTRFFRVRVGERE